MCRVMNEAELARALAWASRIDRFDDTATHVAAFREGDPGSSSCANEANAGATRGLPIGVCAGICASLARRPEDASSVLFAHGIDRVTFRTALRAELERIRNEVKHGGSTLQRAFDHAYVGKLEEERGTIDVSDYVKLVRAERAGNVEATLLDLGLPAEAWLRIQRVWLVRLVRDAVLAEKVRRALDD